MSKYFRVKTLMLKGEKGNTGCGISNVQMNDDYTLTVTLENGMHFNTPPIRGEKGERGACIMSVELRDDYSLLFTLDNGETFETTAILGKEFENIRKLEASASSASKTATSASISASASAAKAKEYADNLQASTDDISQLKEDIGNKAPAIIEKASGKTIIINDSSNLPLKTLSGTGKIIITGKNILNENIYSQVVPFEAKVGTLFTLITNGELSAGGNIMFIGENDEEVWFSIDAGETKTSQKIKTNVKGFINLLDPKEGLKYCFSVGENDEYEEYVEQVITAPLDSEQLKAIHTNYPTTVLTSENEISVDYVADTEEYIGKRIKEELNRLIKDGALKIESDVTK